MQELPFHLKTIEPLPGALDILRFFGQMDTDTADADEIADSLGLSQRSASKAIRRLVTKGYMMMDGDMIYRLTDQGQGAVEELAAFDEANGTGLSFGPALGEASPVPTTSPFKNIIRRMVMAVPAALVANEAASVVIGFNEAHMPENAEIVVRFSVVNGQPAKPEDVIFSLNNGEAHQAVEVVPGLFNQVRLRAEVIQLGPNPGDFNKAGGMYVDVPVVAAESGQTTLRAYGVDITLIL
ncbi:MAG: hypothetical protein OHK0046_40170 [Anaerolineae bacterium]